jgi:two-component system cell cycle sensor histidine kinase/response regulator CckA
MIGFAPESPIAFSGILKIGEKNSRAAHCHFEPRMTNIIIVEDEGLIALDLKKKLQQVGYTVPLIADNATEALLGVELLRPSLVLMDIRLRGAQDGIETADQIRRRFHVPVMFVTAHADLATLDRARIAEPFGYIVKPFHSVDFRAQIEMALWKHKMEQKLRISESWLSTTFRNVADALIATDSDGNIAFMNTPASELTGWGWREAKGKPLLDVFQAFEEMTDIPVVHALDAIRDGREPDTTARTFKLRARGGSASILVEAELSANRDEESLLGIIVVFRDVTGRRKAEKQNRQLQKMNSLALMAIGMGRELSESQARMDDSLKQLIAQSKGSTLRLLGDVYQLSAYQQSVVQQLVTLGRTAPGPTVMVDLNAVLTGQEANFRKALGLRLSLNLKLQPGIPPIQTDPQDLRENLFRLVVDARDAVPDGGVVEISTVTTRSADGKAGVQVAIRDTGAGIQASADERIFDPYYQPRPGNGYRGSLALVYQFVAVSGGFFEVENAPGKGAAYLLSFPSADNSPVPAPAMIGREFDGVSLSYS